MPADDSNMKRHDSAHGVQPAHIPPRPPPRRKIPFKQILIGTCLVVLIGLAKTYFLDTKSLGQEGPKYTSGEFVWQSFNPTWSKLFEEHALDMTVVVERIRSSNEPTNTIDGALLRALCGSVLTKLPNPPQSVSRNDIYRLGFRFIRAEDSALTDKFPLPVQDGSCLAHKDQMIFDWGYPGQLSGWSPVRYEQPKNEAFTITFGRRGKTRVAYDQVDLKVACEALFLDSSDSMRQALDLAPKINIRIVNGVAGGLGWAGYYRLQRFQVVNGTCLPIGNVVEG